MYKTILMGLIIGTWLDSDNGLRNGQRQPPSNVSRISWALKETASDGIPQIVNYQAGVGSMGGSISRTVGGITGLGLEENVREAYSFLSVNYSLGDEIFLLGFSRGAWTARSVAGMVGALGLLTKKGLPCFSDIFQDYEHRFDSNYVPRWPDLPFPNKPPFEDPRYVAELEERGLTSTKIPIKAVGVWDTVGSLGIPRVGWLERIGLQSRAMRDYSFYDTTLNPMIENAFQALSLDEHREPFAPALWEKPRDSATKLRQVWFPGVHSNIGGGYNDADLANITLAWMISQLEPFLEFRDGYMMEMNHKNRDYYKYDGQKPRPWSFGEIHNSLFGLYAFAGSKTRTPGSYFRIDPITGRPTTKRLRNTNEYIHPSVRSRFVMGGPGVQDRGLYASRALASWEFHVEEDDRTEGRPHVLWKYTGNGFVGQDVIPESPLHATEKTLLSSSPKVEGVVTELDTPKDKKRRRRRSRA